MTESQKPILICARPKFYFTARLIPVTTDANKLLRPIHDRMALILDPLVARQWINPMTAIDPRMISVVMVPFPSDLMEAYEVSRLVNDSKNDLPACMDPTVPEPPGPLFDRWPEN